MPVSVRSPTCRDVQDAAKARTALYKNTGKTQILVNALYCGSHPSTTPPQTTLTLSQEFTEEKLSNNIIYVHTTACKNEAA